MSAPTLQTDLQSISTCENITGWTALGGGASGLTQETDFLIQGSFCVSKQISTSGTLKGMWFDTGAANIDLSGQNHAWFWIYMSTNQLIATKAGGGLRVRIGGNPNTNFKEWYAFGSDNYIDGGWKRVAVDATSTADTSGGTLTTSQCQWFGGQASVNGTAKSTNLGIDSMHYGTGHRLYDGDTTTPGTLDHFASFDDTQSVRYGILSRRGGVYSCLGRLHIGPATGSNACRFIQATASMNFYAHTAPVKSDLMGIQITGSQTIVDMTSVQLASTSNVYRGDVIIQEASSSLFTGGGWTGLRTAYLHSSTTVNGVSIESCGTIIQNTGTLIDCTIKNSFSPVALRADHLGQITSVSFKSAGTGHAIECRRSGTFTFVGNTFSGYAPTDGTTGNEAFYNNSSGSITLNVSGGGGTPSVRNGTGASTTINNSVTYTLTGIAAGSEITIVKQSDGTVLYHVESTTGGSEVYSYNYSSDTPIDVLVMSIAYEPFQLSDTLRSTASTVPIQQISERNYSNPA